MNLILIGASGTFGTAIINEAKRKGVEIVTISRGNSDSPVNITCDLTDMAGISGFAESITVGSDTVAIINSGVLGPVEKASKVGMDETIEAFNVNALSNIWLFQELYSKGVKKFAVISSGASIKNYAGWFVYCQTKKLQKSIWEAFSYENEDIAVLLVAPGVLHSTMHDFTEHTDRMDFPDLAKFFELKNTLSYQDEAISAQKLIQICISKLNANLGCEYLDLREC